MDVFFFKQKTAYEMRISDWSSDVCSSDLLDPYEHQFHWDPYPTYQALREQDPVHYNEELDLWFLTKWDDVFAAFRDFKSFINTGATSLEKGSTEALPYPMFIKIGRAHV